MKCQDKKAGEDICDNDIPEDDNRLSSSFSYISEAGNVDTDIGYFQNSQPY